MILPIIVTILGLILLLILIIYLRYFIPLRPKENGFEYVSVELDGSVRELNEEEKGYLKTKFELADGARPYIKSRYNELTPDGKIWGYISRRRVPKRITIKNIAL